MRCSETLFEKIAQRSLGGWHEKFMTTVTSMRYGSNGKQNCAVVYGKVALEARGTGSENYAYFKRRMRSDCGSQLIKIAKL